MAQGEFCMRKNKRIIFKSFVFTAILALNMVLTACNNPTGGETWYRVTSIGQLIGTWKGSDSKTIPIKDFFGEAWREEYKLVTGNMNVGIFYDITMNIDETHTASGTAKFIIKFIGGNIDAIIGEKSLWEIISDRFADEDTAGLPDGITIDDKNHSITLFETGSGVLNDSDLDYMEINKSGTKIRYYSDYMPWMEIVLKKQK